MNYHAHIYFKPEELDVGRRLFASAKAAQGPHFQVWRFFDKKVGPHSLPMFEIHFSHEHKAKVLEWIEENRQGLSVLIHRDSGNDLLDHQETATWLGSELPIDYGFFDLVEANPHLAIHAPHKKD